VAVALMAREATRMRAGLLTGGAYCVALLVNGGFGGPVATSVAALPPGLVAAAVALGAAAYRRDAGSNRWALLLVGAVLVGSASGLATDPPWIPPVVIAAVSLSAPAMGRFDRRWGASGVSPVLMALSAGGLFYTLPDPEEAAILLGASMPLMLLSAPLIRGAYGGSGAWAMAGLFVWTVMAGGYGRESAIVGGLACLGVFAAAPFASLGRAQPPSSQRTVTLAAVHAASVLIASRVVGLQENAVVALAIGVTLIALATLAVWSIEHSGRLGDPGPGDHSADHGPFAGR
jgi:hypothetical protein